nr:immunoglobulin light chain junction region [Macaca mulatta]
CQQHFSYPRTF